jgi:hypothetical protein
MDIAGGLPNSKQPRKAFYYAYSLVSLLVVKLPYFIAESALWPPVRSWTFKKAMIIRIMKWIIDLDNEYVPVFSFISIAELYLE